MKKVLLAHLLLVVLLTTVQTSFGQNSRPVLLNHVALWVKNLPTSTAFYMNVIGLDTVPEPFHDRRHAWFKIGEHSQLHVIQGAAAAVSHEKNTHLCFTVPSVEEFVKVLVNNKIPYEDVPGKQGNITVRVDGVKQIYFKDPDNYWIEINDDKF